MGATREILTSSDDPLLPIALPLGDWLVADVVTIPLTAEQWAFVVSALRRAQDAQTSLGQHEEAAHSAVLQDLITAAVAAGH